jgi:putative FmdB family regulatory protein
MPIYEYECTRCHEHLEAIQGFHDKPLVKCDKCGGKLHKLVSEAAFHLKGSGWYVTDYARSTRTGTRNGKTEAKSEHASSGASEAKPAASGETKAAEATSRPAAKTEA